MQVPGPITLS